MDNKTKPIGPPWYRQLLITVLGTSIGVGLTFTVNRCVDSHKQHQAQHETAIMAVCDIAEITRGLKEEIYLEDSLFKAAMYVSTHQEMIDKMSVDTLNLAFEYLYDNPMTVKGWTADTKENAFNSGIDTRMNLGNNQFYDNVQSCYYLRRSLKTVMEEAPVFRRPISKDDYEAFLQKLGHSEIFNGIPTTEAKRKAMKKFIAQGATSLYINRYFTRRLAYVQVVDELERLNSQNKLLMNITDEDVEKYIRQNSGNESSRNPAELIEGTWEMNLNTLTTYVFYEDNTFERTSRIESQIQIGLKEEQREVNVLTPIELFVPGQWELDGNELTLDCDFSKAEILSIDLDLSGLPQAALERLQDSLDIKEDMLKDSMLEAIRHQSWRYECIISFDKSGNTMVWTSEETTPAGTKHSNSMQLYRKTE